MSARQNAVALTFDDGPHPKITPQVLDALRAHGAHATFFVLGKNARMYPALVRRIVEEGHALGWHTDTHVDLSRASLWQAWKECCQARRCVEEITGAPLRYFRPPWGRLRPSTLLIALATGMRVGLWSLDSLDHRRLDAAVLVERCSQARPGDVLLFHDDGQNALEALPPLLEMLQARGLSCLSLKEMART